MTNTIIATSSSNTGVRVNLAEGDSVYVDAGATLSSTSSNNAVIQAAFGSSSNTVFVAGTVVGSIGVFFSSGPSNYSEGNSISVQSGGSIIGLGSYGAYLESDDSTLFNSGYIYSKFCGALVRGFQDSVINKVFNSGTIEGGTYGLLHGSTSLDTLDVTNTGTIRGAVNSFASLTYEVVDIIRNSGSMYGDVDLYGGNDRFDGRLGHTYGTVFGGDGNDRIYGGSEDNTLNGGDGKDKLLGAGGADTFIFDVALGSSNIDRLVDFTHNSDKISLDDSIFTKLLSVDEDGTLNPSQFFAAVAGTKYAADDRIIYNTDKGRLYYDADGYGGAKAVQFATLDNHASLTGSKAVTADDFLVV